MECRSTALACRRQIGAWWWSWYFSNTPSTSSAYSMKLFGPMTDPCGTPNRNATSSDSVAPLWIAWLRSVRKSSSQFSASSCRPKRLDRTSSMIVWSTVSKAADISSNIMAPTWPWSMELIMLFKTQMTAVSGATECSKPPSWISDFRLLTCSISLLQHQWSVRT